MKRLKLYAEKLKVIKDASDITYQEMNKVVGKNFGNYTNKKCHTNSIDEPTAILIAQKLNCKVEDFTSEGYKDTRVGNKNAGRPKSKPVIAPIPQSWSEVLPNGVIFIHAPFMETWKSSMTNSDLPNCIYHRDSLGMKRKIIEKQKNATVMYLDDWKPIEDIREAFRELREIL